MLNSYNVATRRYLLEIFSAFDIDEGGLSSLGGLRFLVEAARFGSMVSRERACQAIGLLGVRRCARHRLVELGVIPVLVELFRVGDSTTKLVAGNSLGVILSHVDYIGILREGDNESEDVTADVFCDLSDYKHSIPVVISSGAIPILVNLLSDGNVEVRERVSGAIAKLSYDEADRVALADVGAVPLMIDVLHDESEVAEELRDITKEADINFSEGPSLRERISVAIDDLSFQRMEMIRLHGSKEQMVRSFRRMSIEQLTWELGP
ncbi:hypothetical protein Q3G72_012798 [Acer saccharum]|nr:hypothetical protein Q3G72_003486 [Acer saccharum]KAK1582205.1 hypothetical protein Q3G72_012798 [Acer saccharum]